MQRRRFVQLAAVVALGVGASAYWTAARTSAPLFQRFVVAPGDDPSGLPAAIGPAELIEIDRTGALLVHNGSTVRRQRKPYAYQDIKGRRWEVPVRFDILATGDPRLVFGPYDRTLPLVIESAP